MALPSCRVGHRGAHQQHRPVVVAQAFTTRTVQRKAAGNKDATAELLQAAIKFALQQRLRTSKGIEVDVQSNAFDLMGGKFGGMTVDGQGWATPLKLTAQTIQVSVGELMIDQGTLLLQQRVALKNIPQGHCTLVLSAQDLGHFMVHPIMTGAAGKAVRGQAFLFDPNSVQYTVTGPGQGQVVYTGRVGSRAGPAFHITMDAPVHTTLHAGGAQQRQPAHHGSRAGAPHASQQQRIHVTARRMAAQQAQAPQAQATPPSSSNSVPTAAPAIGHAQEDAVVGAALSDLFSCLKINLQGVELSRPALRLMPATSRAVGGAAYRSGGGAGQGAGGDSSSPLLLEISMQLQLKDLPPLNMKF